MQPRKPGQPHKGWKKAAAEAAKEKKPGTFEAEPVARQPDKGYSGGLQSPQPH